MTWEYFTAFLVAVVVALVVRTRLGRSKLPYPPGPKGYPLIGNILDIPPGQEWKTYADWSREYGKIALTSCKNLGTQC